MTGRPAPPAPARKKGPRTKLKSERIQAVLEERAAMTLAEDRGRHRLSYDRLAWEMKALPEWVLHTSGLSMAREESLPSSGAALLFVAVAGSVARLRRRWPIVTFQGERVWITVRNLERGLTEKDLALAHELEIVLRKSRVSSAPSPPLGAGSLQDLEDLAAKSMEAVRSLVASLRDPAETQPAASGSAEAGPPLRVAGRRKA